MPLGFSFEESSALPMVFLTVLYALRDQAKLKAGDRILVHSAAGGVGSAAVQYAKFVGAKIYATASPAKHEYLRSIGVSNISTSRDETVFEEKMSNLVGDSGFDVVLSAGNLTEKSLAMLKDGGRFLELGKRGILSQEDVAQRRPDVEYFTHTFNEFVADAPENLSPMLNELLHYLEAGTLQPLPYQVFDFQSGLVDAFKHLRDGSNIGKIVI